MLERKDVNADAANYKRAQCTPTPFTREFIDENGSWGRKA